VIYYTVSLHVEPAIELEWLQWMQHIHIPQMMETGCFEGYTFTRVLEPLNDEHNTYVAQYKMTEQQKLDEYLEKYAAELRRDAIIRFENRFLVFRTILEDVPLQ